MRIQPTAPRTLVLPLALALALAGCNPPAPNLPPVANPPSVAAPETTPAADPPAPALPPLFDGWTEPAVVLAITGQQLGYIEPCGCTGLENQKGGLARRYTLLQQLREEKGWPVVAVDVGSQVRRFGKQSEIKFQRTTEGLRAMGYRAATLGADDLRLPASELFIGTNPDDQASLFTSVNVALLARDLQPTHQVVEAGGKKIGVAAVLGDSFEKKLQGDEVVHEPALVALKRTGAELAEHKCDFYVLLAHATLDEARQLAEKVPIFDLVVTSGGGGLPSGKLEPIEGTQASLLKVSHKATHVAVIGLFDGASDGAVDSALRGVPAAADHPSAAPLTIRYQSVPLDAAHRDAPEMLQLLRDYQEQLKADGLEGLGLKPQPHPSGRRFVGSETCGECHTKAYAKWSTTPHAHATDSLVHPPNSRGDIARHFDPECLSCHVTGWEPQKFYPFDSGYLSLEDTPKLQHNGCENCHGPGSAHVAAENGEGDPSPAMVAKLRETMRLPIAGGAAENKCRECHDEDNSPDFSHRGFSEYWKEVEHPGKD